MYIRLYVVKTVRSKTVFKNKSKVRGITIPDSHAYFRTMVSKQSANGTETEICGREYKPQKWTYTWKPYMPQ